MPKTSTIMTGKLVVDRIIDADERDFANIQLSNFDFSTYRRNELAEYLEQANLSPLNSFDFEFSVWKNVKATGLRVPYSRWVDVQMKNVNFGYSVLDHGDLYYAKLNRVNFTGASREGVDWRNVVCENVYGLGDREGDPNIPKPSNPDINKTKIGDPLIPKFRGQSMPAAFLERIVDKLRPRL